MPPNGGDCIPVGSNDYVNYWNKDLPATLSLHWIIDHAIDLQPNLHLH
jgi:hypothetical protein